MVAKKKTIFFLLVSLASISPAFGAESSGAAKWGLWSEPQGDLVRNAAVPAPSSAPAVSSPAALPADPVPPAVPDDYVIGPGDVLDIFVWKDEALTRSVTVLPDGKITFPLVGELIASGKTVPQLKKEIVEKIVRYLPEPVLTVEVKQVNSQVIYVLGRVNTPGRFALNSPVNVLQALAMAGGVNPYAARNRIKVIRTEEGKTKVARFRYDDVVDGKRLEENIGLQRGDVVVVP